jgi:hypothetical protein
MNSDRDTNRDRDIDRDRDMNIKKDRDNFTFSFVCHCFVTFPQKFRLFSCAAFTACCLELTRSVFVRCEGGTECQAGTHLAREM